MKKITKKHHLVYHANGSIWARGEMLNGKCEGYWEWFRKPAGRTTGVAGGVGTKMRSGYFKNGKQTGEWTTYDKRGKVFKVTHFNDIK